MRPRAHIPAIAIAAVLVLAAALIARADDLETLMQNMGAAVRTGDYPKAIELAREILAETDNGTKLPGDNLVALETIAGSALLEMGQVEEAGKHIARAVEGLGKQPPKDAQIAFMIKVVRVKWLVARADIDTALTEGKALFAESKEAFGQDAFLTLDIEMLLGLAEFQAGRLDEAEPKMRHVAEGFPAAFEAAYRGATPMIVYPEANLGILLVRRGSFDEAAVHLKKARELLEKGGWQDNAPGIIVYNNLGYLAMKKGDFEQARKLFTRAIGIGRRNGGENNPNYQLAVSNLGVLEGTLGELASAEVHARNVAEANRRLLGDSPQTAISIANLGNIYDQMNEKARSQGAYLEAAEMYGRLAGYRGADFSTTMQNLARVEGDRKRYALAEQTAIRAYRFAREASGAQSAEASDALLAVACIFYDEGLYDRARTAFERVLALREQVYGPSHTEVARAVSWLGDVSHKLNDEEAAFRYYERCAAILSAGLGADSTEITDTHSDLAWTCLRRGLGEKALVEFRAHEAGKIRVAEQILSFTSEAQRLRYLGSINFFDFYGTVGSVPDLARVVLRTKSLALDTILEDRALRKQSADPAAREQFENISAAKSRLAEISMGGRNESGGALRKTEREQLSARIEALEAGLGRQFRDLGLSRGALRVEPAQVQAVLPADAALVEFVSYNDQPPNGEARWSYGALILEREGAPLWLPLGASKPVDDAIRIYKLGVHEKADDTSLKKALRTLGAAVWDPIVAKLPPGVKRVILSPVQNLHFVSFSTLLAADGRFAGEQFDISYVASGRDLLRPIETAAPRTCAVFSNPDFALNQTAADAANDSAIMPKSELRAFAGVELPPLPGTAREQAFIADLAAQYGWQFSGFSAAEATETALRNLPKPSILHLATHGFFLELPPRRDDDKSELSSNPMFRSGLALSGASLTLGAWQRGEVTPAARDGIVTAAEVADLDLRGTWLVTLSACETGGGETDNREGVLGLRRGFVQAGAQNLLMTLWSISDDTTVEIMRDFYARAFKTGNAPQALADTQREWLGKLRRDKGLAEAVRLAGPFIMSSQGKP
jgi:tetratricopeptide (TPR) repeat protein